MLFYANSISSLLSRHELLFLVNNEQVGFFEVALAGLSDFGARNPTARQRDLLFYQSLAEGIVLVRLRISLYHLLKSITRRD